MKQLLRTAIAVSLFIGSGLVLAASTTPVGTWKQIDDVTGKAKSIIEITDNGGKLQAKVTKVMNLSAEEIAKDGEHPTCKLCSGALKDQPIEGMVIMYNVSKDGSVWDGGKIVDPKTGKVYKVKLTLNDDGQKLDVHGYIGFALLGRSQTWLRQ